jgi:hypothetical protein
MHRWRKPTSALLAAGLPRHNLPLMFLSEQTPISAASSMLSRENRKERELIHMRTQGIKIISLGSGVLLLYSMESISCHWGSGEKTLDLL